MTIYSPSSSAGAAATYAIGLLLAASTSGCGGSTATPTTTAPTSVPTAIATAPASTTPSATTPVPTTPAATVTTPLTPTARPTTTTKEPDAGDEQGIRVPATFTFRGGRLSPRTVSVPSFLRIQLTLVSADGRAHRVVLLAAHARRVLNVPAGARVTLLLPGLKRGGYRLRADGAAERASISFGAQPGP